MHHDGRSGDGNFTALQARQAAQAAFGRAQRAEGFLGIGIQLRRALQQLDAPGGAFEQRKPDGLLQFRAQFADGGLRQVQRLGGAGEVLQLVDGAESAELAQRDAHGATPARGGYRTQAASGSVIYSIQDLFHENYSFVVIKTRL
ncbi:hypothetical protein D3C87_1738570 [compost metagenome]